MRGAGPSRALKRTRRFLNSLLVEEQLEVEKGSPWGSSSILEDLYPDGPDREPMFPINLASKELRRAGQSTGACVRMKICWTKSSSS